MSSKPDSHSMVIYNTLLDWFKQPIEWYSLLKVIDIKGLAGSLVFVLYDRAALYGLMQQARYAQKDYGNDLNNAFTGNDNMEGSRLAAIDTPVSDLNMNAAIPTYPDQILPFDITITGRNELGQAMSAAIYGVEFLNHGIGISVEDITIEDQFTPSHCKSMTYGNA